MGIISHLLNQTATTLTTARNKYGDQEYTNGANEACRFREITATDRVNNREDIKADAMIWVEPTSSLVEGTIVRVNDKFYRVMQVTKARKMDATIRFLKCTLEKYFDVEGVS